MSRLYRLLPPGIACLLGALALAPAASVFAAPQPDRPLSPTLVATNLWYGDPAPAVWDQVRDAGVRLIRIGGHAYDRKVPDDETLVAWVTKIRAHGAEPLLQVSQYQPPEKAAELVRLFNVRRAAGDPVRLWSIGNEPWLQNGRKDPASIAAHVEAYFKPIAAAMKRVDPSIKIYGFDEAYFIRPAYDVLFGGQHDITGRVPGERYYYCDGLSWHRYPRADTEPSLNEIADFHKNIALAREAVDRANAKHRRTGDDALQWGLTEFNAKGGHQVHTFGNGQMFGAIYGLSARYGSVFTASWSMFENSGSRGKTDFGAFDGGDFTPRASYWHQRLFAETFSGVSLGAVTSNRDDVLVFASHDRRAGSVGVMILNLSGEDHPYEIRFGDAGGATDELVLSIPLGLRETHADSIAARSSQFLVFKKSRLTKTVYSADDFAESRAPVKTSAPSSVRLPRHSAPVRGNRRFPRRQRRSACAHRSINRA